MTDQPTEAAIRVQKYIDLRKTRRGIDTNEIHGFDVGCDSEAVLTLADLEAILADRAARALTQGEVERVCSTCRHEALSESEGACAGCGYAAPYDRWEPVTAPSALVASPVEMSQLAKDFPPMGGLTECDMGDSYE